MKKSLIIMALLAFATASAGTEVLTNGDFDIGSIHGGWDGGINGWGSINTDFFQHADTGYFLGTFACALWNTATELYQSFPSTPGDSFTVSGKMIYSSTNEPLGAGRSAIIQMQFRDVSGVLQQTNIGTITNADGANVWHTFSQSVTAPSGTTQGRVRILISGGTAGKAHFDDISVYHENPTGDPDFDGDGTVGLPDLAAMVGDWAQSSTVHDLTGDSFVDMSDFRVLAAQWLETKPDGYQLVWQDEFNGTSIDTANWNFETGGYWHNNEIQYYTDNRPENARVENGNLIIEARNEVYENRNYTSARMTTQGKAFWTYGKMEARIKLPSTQGVWPAFWMMPNNNSGWPGGGEIDIMEAINTPSWAKSSLHYGVLENNYHPSSGTPQYYHPGGGDFSHDFHVYSMEWEPGLFMFFVDNVFIGSMEEWWSNEGAFPAPFNKDFFFILNIAVGGDWPGDPVATSVFPQQMLVDWVRVYQLPGQPQPRPLVPTAVPGRIEAEDFDTVYASSGQGVTYYDTDGSNSSAYRATDVDIEACSDIDGGYNTGWTEAGEWMNYTIDVASTGTYNFNVRVASPNSGKSFHIEIDDVDVTGSMSVPNSGGWQNWQTVTKTSVSLSAGEHEMKFVANTDGFNFNYIDIQ